MRPLKTLLRLCLWPLVAGILLQLFFVAAQTAPQGQAQGQRQHHGHGIDQPNGLAMAPGHAQGEQHGQGEQAHQHTQHPQHGEHIGQGQAAFGPPPRRPQEEKNAAHGVAKQRP